MKVNGYSDGAGVAKLTRKVKAKSTFPNGAPKSGALSQKNDTYHKMFRLVAKPAGNALLNEKLISRFVHQVDQRCRDVKPRALKGFGGKPGLEVAEIK